MRAWAIIAASFASVASAAEPAAPPAAPPAATPAAPPAPPATAPDKPPENATLALDVILVNDPDFPELREADAKAILEEARSTMEQKVGFGGLSFTLKGQSTLKAFLDQNAPLGNECLQSFESVRVRPGSKPAKDIPVATVVPFLSRWKVDELKAFFQKEDQKDLASHEAIAQKLLLEFDRKVALIQSFKLKSGVSLLAPEKLEERSYVRWVCAMRAQDQADLVLTNAFILYDLGSEPYPHSIFQKNKVGGASLLSPKRRAMRGRAMVGSSFSMSTDLPFFREEGVEDLREKEKLEVIGSFIVAHELGHALFKLPDFYDHPKECLMTTKYETGYVSGYWYLKAYPGACPKCAPWVEAKRHVFLADDAKRRGDPARAIEELTAAIKLTPKHIDGSYKRYLADLSYEIAEAYVMKGDRAEAARWLQSVLRITPDHADAMALKAQLEAK